MIWHLRIFIFLGLVQSCLGQLYDSDEIFVDPSKHNEQFFTFLSRPDIEAPRWDIKVYNQSALAPGYWFISSYGIVDQSDDDKRYVAPAIYDPSNGELVWNGGPLFDYLVTFDFKVSRFEGHDVLSVYALKSTEGTIIDDRYRVHRHIRADENPHEFQVIENGAKVLYVTKHVKRTSRQNSLTIGYDGRCRVAFPGFQERKTGSEEITFDWKPENKIALNESYLYRGDDTPHSGENTPGGDCPHGPFDYLHLNSVEKLPDGDFLISGRRTYAIHKISRKDGEILWRLGGKKSDFTFEGGTHFTGQHDVRCLEQNKTGILISMMDNAVGAHGMDASNPNSRGLILFANTETMTVKEVAKFDHPRGAGGYAPERGNIQILPNGNVFASWTEAALNSEHTSDGKVIAEASLLSGLKTYRSYKFSWIGTPRENPAVHSQVVAMGDAAEIYTVVSVSWNGDTQARKWNLYKSDVDGSVKDYLTSAPRSGFETAIVFKGFVEYVMVDAEDSDDNKLEKSESLVARTIAMPNSDGSIDPMKEVTTWQDVLRNPIFTFFDGLLFCVAAIYILRAMRKRWTRYRPSNSTTRPLSHSAVDTDEVELAEATGLLDEDVEK